MGRPQKISEAPELRVVEFGNTSDGNYKKMSDGTMVSLSEEEWRVELAKCFSNRPVKGKGATTHTTPGQPVNGADKPVKQRLQRVGKAKPAGRPQKVGNN